LYGGINKFKKSYQTRTNLVTDDRSDLLADLHKILNRWKNYFRQLLNVNWTDCVKQNELHTPEQFVPERNASEVLVAIGK
jgi:hypothetical protein